MKANKPLWIDSNGVLCDAPPSTGIKIAGVKGYAIKLEIIKKFDLVLVDGAVTQKGKDIKSPKTTAPKLIADRELFANEDGEIFDDPQSTGIKVCSVGDKIPREYILRYNLFIDSDGDIAQKSLPNLKKVGLPKNKMAAAPSNKTIGGR